MNPVGARLSIIISGFLGIFLLVWIWPSNKVRVQPKEIVAAKNDRPIKMEKPTNKSTGMTVAAIYLPPPPPPAESSVNQEANQLEVLKPKRMGWMAPAHGIKVPIWELLITIPSQRSHPDEYYHCRP